MRFVVLIPLFSCLVYLAWGERRPGKLTELEAIVSPSDPDAAKMQEQVKHPPGTTQGLSRNMPVQPTCVDLNGIAYGSTDAGFDDCRARSVPRDTASGIRGPQRLIEPIGVPSATRPGVGVRVGR